MDGDNSDETFTPTSGRVLGLVAVAVGLGVAAVGLLDGRGVSWPTVAAGSLFAAAAWASLLRPRVAIEDDALVLRGMVDTVRLPLAAVEDVVVRQVLAVRVGDKRFTSPAVGRPRRQLSKDDAGAGGSRAAEAVDLAAGVFVQERIRSRAANARDTRGIRVASPEQLALAADVRRVPAVPEIVWLVGSLVALVVAVAL